jgi:glycosyltransferase involved in cell wall biosynthesis
MKDFPLVSVVIPCRNERGFIGSCLDSLLASDYPPERLEILVADGMSDDGTREILKAYCARYPQIRLIENPKKIVPTGLNQAIQAARGEVIVRMDAHSEYARDYIGQCVAVLEETGAANVVGAAQTKTSGDLQEAIALAFHSPFSGGGASWRDVHYEGETDTVTYGCWRKQTLLDAGLFDEELVRNQDDELNLRLVRRGGRIWQSARIRSWYSPRPSLKALFKQYSQYGYWKVRVIQKHKLPASPRHLVPGLWVGSTLALAVLSFFSPIAFWLLILETALYLAANFAATAVTCWRADKLKFLPLLPVVFATYHFSYGYGFLRGMMDFVLLRRNSRASFNSLSRKPT